MPTSSERRSARVFTNIRSLDQDMEIKGSVALVTDAAKRVGREITLELTRRDARIAMHYKSSASEAMKVANAGSAMFQADLTDTRAVERMFRDVDKVFGRLDILVNSASVFSPTTAEDANPEHWDSQMDTNAKAPFF